MEGLVDLGSVFEANYNRIKQAALHCKAYGLFAVFGFYEVAVADDFHTNYAVTVFAHNLELFDYSRQVGEVTGGIPALYESINVDSLGIYANEVHIDPIELCGA